MWFKPSAAKAKAKDSGAKEDASKTKADAATPTKPKNKRSSAKEAKTLVQRRIHIRDLCRVCEESRLEEQSRCDLRCADCSMTVHKVRRLLTSNQMRLGADDAASHEADLLRRQRPFA